MPPEPEPLKLAFVFESLTSARAAMQRLESAGLATMPLELEFQRHAAAGVRSSAPCILTVHLQAGHDESQICELVRGSARLMRL